ncbi:D-alanyl-D-alanine carboxypeptidase family protein [Ornithinibacillus halotolerans]|uniref:SH3b domain-containing protein n=1 Tax=Ornithinibacillus halotolerans TaxID=1274357 RepID=A0A916W4I7_9BACI|nr:D-alanyl-D-alanine carboxypeptidase family protein [Ornithinibacillus halotolerans]GGA64974.1 hypothetical protein GCM10008025_05960 [Ornithinibacillus halotolerans]
MNQFFKKKSNLLVVFVALLVGAGITIFSLKDASNLEASGVIDTPLEKEEQPEKGKEESPIEKEKKTSTEEKDDKADDEEKKTPKDNNPKKEESEKPKINETPVTHKDYQTTTELNLRTGPSPDNKKIVAIPKGKNVTHIATSGHWYKVQYGKHTGYVNSGYLEEVGTVDTSKEKSSKSTNSEAKQPTKATYVQGILIANKKYPLPANYAPGESKEARNAFNKMAAAAKKDGIGLVAFSTYRSYATQQSTYDYWVSKDGQSAADRYSAKPGTSEHQTGLAFDIHETGKYDTRFEESDGTRWMAENAHTFGFIVRYPKGKEHITGYMYEPWHLRYLGVDIATKVFNSGLTLEEYLGIQ